MIRRVMLLAAVATFPLTAQTHSATTESLAQLLAELPSQVAASNPFDLAAFSDRIDPLLHGSNNEIEAAIPICGRNLHGNSEVRQITMVILSILASRPDGQQLLSPLIPQINEAFLHDRDGTQKSAAVTLTALGEKAPDSSVAAMRQLLGDRHADEYLRANAAGALLQMRPADPGIATEIASMIGDGGLSQSLRLQIISVVAREKPDAKIIDAILALVNDPPDKSLRDAAITATRWLGAPAVSRVQESLVHIVADPNETAEARHNAKVTLMVIQPSSEDVYSP
jgi:hypothetical protein